MRLGKTFVLTVLAFVCIFAAFLPGDARAAAKKRRMDVRVMSFNIRYGSANDGDNRWTNRREMVSDVIKQDKSDVVGLREALRFQIDEIRKALPQYGEIGVAREDGKEDGEFSSILYRKDRFEVGQSGTFWLSDTPEVPGSKHWGNVCVRICSWARLIDKKTGRAFYMFNLHLGHVSQPSREKSAVLVAKRIKDREHKDPFVITGDFNTAENNPVIRYLKGEIELEAPWGGKAVSPVPMVDTFRVLNADAKEAGTFNGFKGTKTGGKIDFVLAEGSTKVLEAKILHDNVDGRYPSDHFPVTATLRFRARKAR